MRTLNSIYRSIHEEIGLTRNVAKTIYMVNKAVLIQPDKAPIIAPKKAITEPSMAGVKGTALGRYANIANIRLNLPTYPPSFILIAVNYGTLKKLNKA
jgi:hypothetical protein